MVKIKSTRKANMKLTHLGGFSTAFSSPRKQQGRGQVGGDVEKSNRVHPDGRATPTLKYYESMFHSLKATKSVNKGMNRARLEKHVKNVGIGERLNCLV